MLLPLICAISHKLILALGGIEAIYVCAYLFYSNHKISLLLHLSLARSALDLCNNTCIFLELV